MTASTATFRAAAWRSSAFCGPNGGNCVEVNLTAAGESGVVGVRDSKRGADVVLAFPEGPWQSFTGAVRAGDLDRG